MTEPAIPTMSPDNRNALAALQQKFDAHERAAGEMIWQWRRRAEQAEAERERLSEALLEAEAMAEFQVMRHEPDGSDWRSVAVSYRQQIAELEEEVGFLKEWALEADAKVRAFEADLESGALIRAPAKPDAGTTATPNGKAGQAAMARLEDLIGLASVKREVEQLMALAEVRSTRQRAGMPNPDMSLHLVFTGNPGTGKTTVARIVAQRYRGLGLLRTAKVTEANRSDLIGGYIGQTAIKTRAVIEKALDGVLFIDEAYALHRPDVEADYGAEAQEELLRGLEDYRGRLIVILAGYAEPMAALLRDGNPGLRSRFGRVVDFPDYAPDELMAIFERFCTDQGYRLVGGAGRKARRTLARIHRARGRQFGNGRTVRNFFEACLMRQAARLTTSGLMKPITGKIDRARLNELTDADIPGETEFRE